ncbi:hypothetical protein [Paenibacillus sp. SI8]|uniref:hypothetical protein n=1 Tax=unclassified Paenibacillus TaxID=185978 RepID=UPI003465921C
MMRFKKSVVLFASVSLLLIGAQSAFASDGVADSRSTAITLAPGNAALQTISDSSDVDYFKWTNTTGTTIGSGSVYLYNPTGLNFDLQFTQILSQYGNFESVTNSSDNGAGQVDSVQFSPIYPGDTLYFKVFGHNSNQYSTSTPYTIAFTTP